MQFTDIYKQLETILQNHECKCYEIDKENKKLIFIGHDNACCTLDPAVADVSGFLLQNGIDYDMDANNNITLNI